MREIIRTAGLLLIVAFFFPQDLFSQFSLSGKITDKESGAGLPGAHVVVKNSDRSTYSENDGAYLLTGLAAGSYTLEVSFVGYRTASFKVDLDTDKVVGLALEYQAVLSDEVIVQASRVDKNAPTTYSTVTTSPAKSSRA